MNKVLIIDDDELILEVLKLFFEDKDFETFTAVNPQAGRVLFQMHPDSVVITDMFMPNRGGFGLIKDIKDQFPEAKIIAISGGVKIGYRGDVKGKEKSLSLAKEYGVNYVFRKPLDLDELLESVLSLCD